jgi:type I restriction enzyme S subunit
MEKYQSYKPSDVEWIGEIPYNWKETRLKYVGNLYGGLTGKSGEDFKQEDNPNNKPYIPYTNIFRNTYISKNHVDYVVLGDGENQNKVQKFDLFFLMSSETYQDLGKPCILVDDIDELYLNSFCKGFRVNRIDVNPLFLNYQLLGSIHKELISIEGRGFTRINLRQDRLNETPIILPPLTEQLQIVQFLDEKTDLIDKLISTKERKITLLKEQRKLLINQVVTKGLNPNVKMKETGIEWIREVPEHWLLISLHKLLQTNRLEFQDGNHGGEHPNPEEFIETGVPFIKPRDIQDGNVDWSKCDRLPFERCSRFRIGFSNNDDVLLVNRGGSIGKVCYVNDYNNEFPYFIINPQVTYLRGKNGLSSKYVYYITKSDVFRCGVDLILGHGSTFPFLGLSNMGDFQMVLPPQVEQQKIVEYLDSQTKEIDDLIHLEQKKIDLLKEYRKSLISDVVTGKVKVTQ